MFLQIVDEELVAPATPTTRLGICGIRRSPIFAQTLKERRIRLGEGGEKKGANLGRIFFLLTLAILQHHCRL